MPKGSHVYNSLCKEIERMKSSVQRTPEFKIELKWYGWVIEFLGCNDLKIKFCPLCGAALKEE